MKRIVLIASFALTGCASDSLYFGTYTRVGIDASTDGAGIGVKNAALNIAPTKKDGSAFDVLGTSDIDLAYTDVVIKEIVAVGEAAKCAAQRSKPADAKSVSATADTTPAVGPVIFGAYTSWSLVDLSWGGATAQGINFGYKRGVGVKLPIINDTVGSVYASVSINTTDSDAVAAKTNVGGTRNIYTFATGTAAIIKAAQEAKALNGGDASYEGCLK